MTPKEKHDQLMRYVIEYMNDFDVSEQEKKVSAIALSSFAVFRTAFNPDEAQQMFRKAENDCLDTFEDYLSTKLN